MSTWKITGISLLAASIMGAIFLLASPANAQPTCSPVEQITDLAKARGLDTKLIDGDQFDALLFDYLNEVGQPKSGVMPVRFIVAYHEALPTVVILFVSDGDMICDAVKAPKKHINGVLEAATGAAV